MEEVVQETIVYSTDLTPVLDELVVIRDQLTLGLTWYEYGFYLGLVIAGIIVGVAAVFIIQRVWK